MLADQLDYVIGVDTHHDTHALTVIEIVSGGVVFEETVAASGEGYAQLLRLAGLRAPGRRVFAVEGTGSYGACLARSLAGRGSGCSRSAGCDGSGARAARPTRSTRSGPPGREP